MERSGRIWPHIVGRSRNRQVLVLAVIALVLLATGGFVLGLPVGFSLGWIAVAFGIAVAAGAVRAGLVPTVGSLWLVTLWWFVCPPLVGYLTGDWATATRYSYPRALGYGYSTAAAELRGGIEAGLTSGLVAAVLIGTGGYLIGTVTSWAATQLKRRG
ncbi:hypothetical protein C483_18428 [Natrialba hulunbeirensis JCM 10989]|uniref:Uncharacterized protein n=1 Tax=Natrialba hulunbeirensis JCM 10989 TaxID=1227493 RepID=L9ZL86_9EURY|nr:hypothetical protein [Natrialba hulunbeirensis]ELY87295.1 hypothetical protein C483_18428 [Natrialba hulunbeirensis JCM 10989]